MGLKFGIHLMRGVPKVVVGSNYKLKGSEQTPWTQVYNGTTSPCGWLGDNLRVRDNKYGQLYYNSIMDLYAEWGVDFLKIDDLSRPFYTDEVQMIRRAIDPVTTVTERITDISKGDFTVTLVPEGNNEKEVIL